MPKLLGLAIVILIQDSGLELLMNHQKAILRTPLMANLINCLGHYTHQLHIQIPEVGIAFLFTIAIHQIAIICIIGRAQPLLLPFVNG